MGLFVKKERHHFADKGLYNQGYSLSSNHVRLWELEYKKGRVLKNWCFWIVVLEKTLESPLDCKEIKPVNLKGTQRWKLIGRTDAEAEALILRPPVVKSWLTGRVPDTGEDWRQKEKRVTENEMVEWYHWCNGPKERKGKSLSHVGKLWKMIRGREAWRTAVYGITKSPMWLGGWLNNNNKGKIFLSY